MVWLRRSTKPCVCAARRSWAFALACNSWPVSGLSYGERKGLGWIGGVCRQLVAGPGNPLPHTGWNEVTPTRPHPVLDALAPAKHCYFNHSFVLNPPADARAAITEHGERFAAAVAKDNLVGVQFHPEKSQAAGLALLKRFVDWTP